MALFQPVANPMCSKSIRTVMVSMKTNLHMRVDYAQGTRVIYSRLRDVLSHKGVPPLW